MKISSPLAFLTMLVGAGCAPPSTLASGAAVDAPPSASAVLEAAARAPSRPVTAVERCRVAEQPPMERGGPNVDPAPSWAAFELLKRGECAKACPYFLWLFEETASVGAALGLSTCRGEIGDPDGACDAARTALRVAKLKNDERLPLIEDKLRDLGCR